MQTIQLDNVKVIFDPNSASAEGETGKHNAIQSERISIERAGSSIPFKILRPHSAAPSLGLVSLTRSYVVNTGEITSLNSFYACQTGGWLAITQHTPLPGSVFLPDQIQEGEVGGRRAVRSTRSQPAPGAGQVLITLIWEQDGFLIHLRSAGIPEDTVQKVASSIS